MNPNKAIYYILANDATVSGIVSNRIYQLRAEQGAPYPLVMIQKISDVPYSDDIRNSLFRARIQVNSYHTNYNDAHRLATACMNALDGVRTQTVNAVNVIEIEIENETDLIEDFSEFDGLFHVAQDYFIVYQRIAS